MRIVPIADCGLRIGKTTRRIADCGLEKQQEELRIADRNEDRRLEGSVGKPGAMNAEVLKSRTKRFALKIIELCQSMPRNREGRLIGDQIFRCGTSAASNYRAACRARSRAEFIAKMGIVEEEVDETLFWLELIDDIKLLDQTLTAPLIKEGNELLSIVVSSINTARKKAKP
jgi:four helix bundle protein